MFFWMFCLHLAEVIQSDSCFLYAAVSVVPETDFVQTLVTWIWEMESVRHDVVAAGIRI